MATFSDEDALRALLDAEIVKPEALAHAMAIGASDGRGALDVLLQSGGLTPSR